MRTKGIGPNNLGVSPLKVKGGPGRRGAVKKDGLTAEGETKIGTFNGGMPEGGTNKKSVAYRNNSVREANNTIKDTRTAYQALTPEERRGKTGADMKTTMRQAKDSKRGGAKDQDSVNINARGEAYRA
tara:strand:+ start:209 stop:592 length:384 start_codon:yes stop_codon:yes gene_type:complete